MVNMDTLDALKAMAVDPKKRLALAKDATCIGGLVIVLSNANYCVVQEALQILLLLGESSEAKSILRNHVGMLDQLEKLLNRGEKGAEVKHLAKQLLSKLYDDPEPAQTPLKDSSNISRYSKNNSNQGWTSGKSIVLQLRGFHDKSDRFLCSAVSVLAASVAKSMTMTAQQVVKNDNGEEAFISFNSSGHSGGCDKEQDTLPDYLSDDSEMTVGEKAVKKPTEEDRQKSKTWFSAAANFLTNSFYW
ncbi:unnamed protein product [Candidula unifasciata]|uniref:Armadillo repeat-containing protein 1 n=1 Tax=Candidula unifasciata TaxID=100452 RepID=A0A8S3ZRP2_9EUPU|nr:unnamed protein product [Candidula unifasciata]